MTKANIVLEITKDRAYLDYCKKVCQFKDLHKDLYQYTILYLLEMDEKKLVRIYKEGGIRMYVARIIYINVNSSRSQFRKQFTSTDTLNFIPDTIMDVPEGVSESLEKVEKKIKEEVLFCHQKNVYPASVKLLEIYAELGSYQAVSDATRIPYKTVRRHIQGLTEKIRKSI